MMQPHPRHSPHRSVVRGNVLCLALVACALAACAPQEQRRSVGTVIDDQTLEARVIDVLFSRPDFDDQDHVKIEVHNGTVLLAGETKSEENRALATELTQELRGVRHVVNDLAVMAPAQGGGRFNNSYITSKVNTVLTTENPIAGFDATRIKVLTARGIVYLMGTVTRAEGEAVTEVVRNIRGVEKVVKVFDYTDCADTDTANSAIAACTIAIVRTAATRSSSMMPKPPRNRRSSERIGQGLAMSNTRNSAKPASHQTACAGNSASTSHIATISSQTMAPGSALPMR